MKKQLAKNLTASGSLDKRMAHLEKTMENLSETVDNLAQATAKGFANTATKQDLENLGNRIDNSLEEYTRTFRVDYDELSSRVRRLESTVFKR